MRGLVIGAGLLGLLMTGCGAHSGEAGKTAEESAPAISDAAEDISDVAEDISNAAEDISDVAKAVSNRQPVVTADVTAQSEGKQEKMASQGPSFRQTQPDTAAGEASDRADIPVIHMENPSWAYFLAQGAVPDEPAAAALKLVKLTEQANGITDTEQWFEKNHLDSSPAEPGGAAGKADSDRYSCEILNGSNRWEAYSIQVTDKVKGDSFILDFSDYRFANDFKESDKDFAEQRIRYAQVEDGILYLSIGHLTYAETSPHNAYVAAVDLAEKKLLWKSQPLVSNASQFVIVGDVILSGYGFTAEPDYLYQLDRKSGRVIAQLPIKSKADYLILKDQILYVRTYNMDYTFQIQ